MGVYKMAVCKSCKQEVSRVYDGICASCLSVRAVQDTKKKLDTEHKIEGLEINTPIKSDNELMQILRFGQGNFVPSPEVPKDDLSKVTKSFAQSANTKQNETKQEPTEEIKVIKTPELIHIVCRPAGEVRFAGTIDASKIDGSIYGVDGDNVWYFNRLFVPKQIRKKGIASRLLQELVKIMEEDKIIMICEINAYGDLEEEELVDLYKKYGFKETPDEYLLYIPKRK